MMEAVNTSETSVNFYESIRRNIPEDCQLIKISLNFNCISSDVLSKNCKFKRGLCFWYEPNFRYVKPFLINRINLDFINMQSFGSLDESETLLARRVYLSP
jgi:hypothetical protein